MAHPKRNSISSLLPLPTTIASADSPSSPVISFSAAPPPAVQLPHGSTFSGTHPLPLNVSNILLHNSQFSGHPSTTHAGGIQPSANFFKPKRPGQYSVGTGSRYLTMGISANDAVEDSDDVFQVQPKPFSAQSAMPHPLSPTFSTGTLSPSLSQHHHHHSNHSLEDLKEHEDCGVSPSDTEDVGRGKRAINPKLSREPLIDPTPGLVLTIPGTPSRVLPHDVLSIGGDNNFYNHTSKPSLPIGPNAHNMATPVSATSSSRFGLMRTVFGSGVSGGGNSATNTNTPTPPLSAISASLRRNSQDPSKTQHRNSLDVSINTKKSKRNSVYKPRLTFESLRRSSVSKDDASRRESYVGTTEDEMDPPRHLFVDDGIPLTPTKTSAGTMKPKGLRGYGHSELGTPRKARARKSKRTSFAGSTSSPSGSRSPSSSVGSTDIEEGSSVEGSGTPTPGMFNPIPPILGRGQAPKMRTPLRHPLDPSLVPIEKLEKELALKTKKRRRKGVMDKVMGPTFSSPGGIREKQPGLPTSMDTPISSSPSSKNNPLTFVSRDLDDEGEEKEGKLARRYELYASRNRFFMRGKVMTGGDSPWAFVMSVCLVFGLAGIWFGTTGVWWWREAGRSQVSLSLGHPPPVGLDGLSLGGRRPGSTGAVGVEGRDWTWVTVNANARRAGKAIVIVCAYLAGIVVSSMAVTAFSDPGILPRGLDLDPPYPANSPSDGGVRAPMPRDLKVRSDVVRVKYCPTCKTYRPPRASHCKMCDNCVDGCDHHCQWVNNCVGSRNYTTFFVLLMSSFLTLIMIIVTAALHIYFLTVWQGYDFEGALEKGAGSAVGFCLAILVIWPVGALLTYHFRLLLLNITTIEQIRNQAHKTLVPGPPPPNPFSHGSWKKNWIAVLCKPRTPSWLDASGVATEDRREVNPGLLCAEAAAAATILPTLREVDGRQPGRRLDSGRSEMDDWAAGGIRVAHRKDDEEEDDG